MNVSGLGLDGMGLDGPSAANLSVPHIHPEDPPRWFKLPTLTNFFKAPLVANLATRLRHLQCHVAFFGLPYRVRSDPRYTWVR